MDQDIAAARRTRLPMTVARLHAIALACLRLHRFIGVVAQSP